MQLMEFLKTYTDYVIFGVLVLMNCIALYKILERSIFYVRIKPQDYDNIHALKLDLTRGLTPIYTAGATAPYVGLLGTVIGILTTFYDMGSAGGDIEAEKIMIGLALALKATAAGILVAIPAVMCYNALTAKAEAKILVWKAYNDRQ